MKIIWNILLLSTAGLMAAGCSKSGSSGSSVSGAVTYKAAPVTGGIMLLHGNDKAYPATLGPDGKYTCQGVPPGDYTVTLDTKWLKNAGDIKSSGKQFGQEMKLPPDFEQKMKEMGKGNAAVYVPIPEKYSSAKTSDLKVNVGSGSNTKDFQLTD
jgi:hypothetical protein